MEELIRRIKAGDQASFKILYEHYADYTIRVASAITKNNAVAADAVQETFIRVYKNIQSFDENKPFEPWLYRILINECNRILEKQSKTILISNHMEDELLLSKEDSYKFEEYEELYSALEGLEDQNRIPIILKYLRGFTENEIADVMELNVNTVKSRLYKGRERLRKVIEKYREGRQQYE